METTKFPIPLTGIFKDLVEAMQPDENGVTDYFPVEDCPLIKNKLQEEGLDVLDLIQEGGILWATYEFKFKYVNPEDYSSNEIEAFGFNGYREYPEEYVFKKPQNIILTNRHKQFEELIKEVGFDECSGISLYVYKQMHFKDEYIDLYTTNGVDWCRDNDKLNNKFIIKKTYDGQHVNGIRTLGYNYKEKFNQSIAKEIRDYYADFECVVLGIRGFSENTRIEIDHKDGRKMDERVSDTSTQVKEDFQPLCKAANDVKRQICKHCKVTNKRWKAKHIKGNPYDFYEGDERYTEELGCVGCYQYDPVAYRITSAKRLTQETLDYVMDKLYPELKEENK